MANTKISALTAATTPLVGTEVLPIVQSGSTVKVANNDLRPKQIQSNSTSGVLQITGPAAAATRVMTTPDANFTVARTDAGQTFTGNQTFGGDSPYVYIQDTVNPASDVGLYLGAPAAATYAGLLTNFASDQLLIRHNGATRITISSGGNATLNTGNLVQGTAATGVNFTANTGAAGMTSQLLNWYEEGTWTPALAFGGASTGITYNAQAGTYTRIGRLVHCFARLSLSSKGSAAGSATITGLPFTSASGDASNGGVMTPSLYSNMASLTGLSGYVGASSTTINLGNDGATDTNGINATNFTNSTTIYFSVQYYV